MEAIIKTTDPTIVSFTEALLKAEDIYYAVLDQNVGTLMGGTLSIPKRVMVSVDDLENARIVLEANGIVTHKKK